MKNMNRRGSKIVCRNPSRLHEHKKPVFLNHHRNHYDDHYDTINFQVLHMNDEYKFYSPIHSSSFPKIECFITAMLKDETFNYQKEAKDHIRIHNRIQTIENVLNFLEEMYRIHYYSIHYNVQWRKLIVEDKIFLDTLGPMINIIDDDTLTRTYINYCKDEKKVFHPKESKIYDDLIVFITKTIQDKADQYNQNFNSFVNFDQVDYQQQPELPEVHQQFDFDSMINLDELE